MTAAVLLAGTAAIWSLGGDAVRWVRDLAIGQLGAQAWLSADVDFAAGLGRGLLQQLAGVLLPLLGCLLLTAIAAQVVQFGVLFLPERVAPDPSRIHPGQGWQRLFSWDSLLRTAIGTVKLGVILIAAGWGLWSQRGRLLALSGGDVPAAGSEASQILLSVIVRTLAALALLAVLDFLYQRWRHERALWMTDQELREEMRNERSDPLIGQRRRHLQQQMLDGQLTREVPAADLLIIAGGSLAIAIKYDPATMAAPQVVAKGVGPAAIEVHRTAQQHGIWTVDDRRLARQLYRRVAGGGLLPPDLYPAVAAVLATMPGYRDLPATQTRAL